MAKHMSFPRMRKPRFDGDDKPGKACVWPIGEPRSPEFRFCGAPAVAGRSYCQEHIDRAYAKAPIRS